MFAISDKKQVGKIELFTVELPDGTTIQDCKIMDGTKGKWVAGPSRSYQDKKTGETKYVNLVKFGFATQKQIIEAYDGVQVPDVDVNKMGMDADDIPF
jgi:DNA-binding cell septation regulator SpoVG